MAVLAPLLACAPAAAAEPTGTITEFSLPSGTSAPTGIAPGPDGSMWFTEFIGNRIGRITPSGAVSEFALPNAESGPTDIVAGPDGNLWFTDSGSEKKEGRGEKIGRITPAGTITEYSILSKEAAPEDITLGSDGNLWFTEGRRNRIGRITPTGEVAEFPTAQSTGGIAPGPDGNIWFTEPGNNTVGYVTPNGTIHEFEVPAEGAKGENSSPEDITAGVDGNLWFTEAAYNRIGRITPGGTITQFAIPTEGSGPAGIAAGPDGNVWFTEFGGGSRRTVGRITPSGSFTEFLTPTEESGPFDVAPSAGGGLWLTERAKGRIGVLSTGAAAALATAPTISGSGLVGTTQTCNGMWNGFGSISPSPTLYGFDGYTWLLDGAPVGSGPGYVPGVAQVGHALSCVETVTYPVPFLVTSSAASQPIQVVEPPPALSAVRQSTRVWREGGKLAQISRRHRARPPLGTTFTFTLNEPATVTFGFTTRAAGRKVRGRCVVPNRHNVKRRRCSRTVPVGTLTFAAHAGQNTVAFQGRLSARSKLRAGTYTLVISATNVLGARSAPAALTFTVR